LSYLGIDVGTTGCKVVAFSERGEIIARSYREYPLYYPQTGWIELDAEEVYRAVEDSLQEVSQGLLNDPPRSLAISSQGEAVVPVGEGGECLARSIVTFDQRGDEFVPFWEEKVGRKPFFELTGTSLSGIGTVNKILWWKKYKKDVFEKARYFLCFEDFIMYRLGVEPAISFSLAGRTMMFEVQKEKWSEKILSLAGIDPMRLARPLPSGEVVGEVAPSFAQKMGWKEKVIVATGGHDQPCGALGSGVIKPALAMDATGTVECIAPALGQLVLSPVMEENNLCCYHHAFPSLYLTMVYNFTGGALLRWFRDNFAQKEKEIAERENCDVYDLILSRLPSQPTNIWVLPHFTTTGTPYFDTQSGGVIVGLKLETSREEFIKALLEGVSYEMKFNLELLSQAGVKVERLRAVGGGAKSPAWLQIKADVYGLPVETLSVTEAASLGAALLGRKAREKIEDFAGLINQLVQVRDVYEPDKDRNVLYKEKFEVYKRIYPALKNHIWKGER